MKEGVEWLQVTATCFLSLVCSGAEPKGEAVGP